MNKKPFSRSIQSDEVLADTSNDDSSSKLRQIDQTKDRVKEHGGPKGPEPTRYGDWEKNGRCTDF